MVVIKGYRFFTGRLSALCAKAKSTQDNGMKAHIIVSELSEDEVIDVIKSMYTNDVYLDKISVYNIESMDETSINDVIQNNRKSDIDKFFIHANGIPSEEFITKYASGDTDVYWYYQEKRK